MGRIYDQARANIAAREESGGSYALTPEEREAINNYEHAELKLSRRYRDQASYWDVPPGHPGYNPLMRQLDDWTNNQISRQSRVLLNSLTVGQLEGIGRLTGEGRYRPVEPSWWDLPAEMAGGGAACAGIRAGASRLMGLAPRLAQRAGQALDAGLDATRSRIGGLFRNPSSIGPRQGGFERTKRVLSGVGESALYGGTRGYAETGEIAGPMTADAAFAAALTGGISGAGWLTSRGLKLSFGPKKIPKGERDITLDRPLDAPGWDEWEHINHGLQQELQRNGFKYHDVASVLNPDRPLSSWMAMKTSQATAAGPILRDLQQDFEKGFRIMGERLVRKMAPDRIVPNTDEAGAAVRWEWVDHLNDKRDSASQIYDNILATGLGKATPDARPLVEKLQRLISQSGFDDISDPAVNKVRILIKLLEEKNTGPDPKLRNLPFPEVAPIDLERGMGGQLPLPGLRRKFPEERTPGEALGFRHPGYEEQIPLFEELTPTQKDQALSAQLPFTEMRRLPTVTREASEEAIDIPGPDYQEQLLMQMDFPDNFLPVELPDDAMSIKNIWRYASDTIFPKTGITKRPEPGIGQPRTPDTGSVDGQRLAQEAFFVIKNFVKNEAEVLHPLLMKPKGLPEEHATLFDLADARWASYRNLQKSTMGRLVERVKSNDELIRAMTKDISRLREVRAEMSGKTAQLKKLDEELRAGRISFDERAQAENAILAEVTRQKIVGDEFMRKLAQNRLSAMLYEATADVGGGKRALNSDKLIAQMDKIGGKGQNTQGAYFDELLRQDPEIKEALYRLRDTMLTVKPGVKRLVPRYEQVGAGMEVESPITKVEDPSKLFRFLMHFASSKKLVKMHVDPTEADPLKGELRPGWEGNLPMNALTALRRGTMATELPDWAMAGPADVASRLVGTGERQQ